MKLLDDQILHLESLRESTDDKKIYIRYTIIIMWSNGFTYQQIARALGIGVKTVQRAVKVYVTQGSEQLGLYKYVGRSDTLTEDQIVELEDELQTNLYVKVKEIKAFILERFNVDKSISAITKLLKKRGFVYKKAKVHPGKADGGEQLKMVRKIKRLFAQKSKHSKVFFIDGTHPVYNTEACYGWIKKGKEYPIPSSTGRKRININGALDGDDPSNVFVDYTDSVNAQSTIRLMEQIKAKHKEAPRIHIYSDNAMYYRSKVLKEWLQTNKKIIWHYLPPYSPNLNLIERLWGFMKREKIKGFYHQTFGEFEKEIKSFFKNIKNYNEQLSTLLTLNFQIISWD